MTITFMLLLLYIPVPPLSKLVNQLPFNNGTPLWGGVVISPSTCICTSVNAHAYVHSHWSFFHVRSSGCCSEMTASLVMQCKPVSTIALLIMQ